MNGVIKFIGIDEGADEGKTLVYCFVVFIEIYLEILGNRGIDLHKQLRAFISYVLQHELIILTVI